MTGPEHYAVAERHLRRANEVEGEDAQFHNEQAQAHATLALAAATIDAHVTDSTTWENAKGVSGIRTDPENGLAWSRVIT